MFLYITASRGLFRYNLKTNKLTNIISNWHKGLFNRPSKGFFGLCCDIKKDQLVAVSRENLNPKLQYDKSTGVIVHILNRNNLKLLTKIKIESLFDVHQISYFNDNLFLTETGKNRIQVLNLKKKIVDKYINVGNIREDVNHINAINVDKNYIFIGLNNGHKKNIHKNSQLIKIDQNKLNLINDIDIDALGIGSLINLENVFHTHDIEKFNDDYLISSSYIGKIYSLNTNSFLKDLKPWTRGIAVSQNNIFIGKSGIGKRKFRHSRYYDGEIFILEKNNLDFVRKFKIKGIGQLNDILYSED